MADAETARAKEGQPAFEDAEEWLDCAQLELVSRRETLGALRCAVRLLLPA